MAELDVKSSSSKKAVPDKAVLITPLLITGVVSVLLVNVFVVPET